jgi:hypothetical protein
MHLQPVSVTERKICPSVMLIMFVVMSSTWPKVPKAKLNVLVSGIESGLFRRDVVNLAKGVRYLCGHTLLLSATQVIRFGTLLSNIARLIRLGIGDVSATLGSMQTASLVKCQLGSAHLAGSQFAADIGPETQVITLSTLFRIRTLSS